MNTQLEARDGRGLFTSQQKLKTLGMWLIDLVFPPTCHSCGRVDTRWCDVCTGELTGIPIQGVNYPSQYLNALYATGKHEGQLKHAVQALKYNNAPAVARPLGTRLANALQQKVWTFDTILPVPLFADRERKRGYNQAYLLSQQVSKMLNIPCDPNLLIKHRHTNQQVGLSASERRVNVRDAFRASSHVAGKSILIIDDVVTTGSTLDECALALQDAGATSIYAITVTHA